MTLTSSTIFLRNLHVHAYHGVMEQEQCVGADFTVNLRVHYNISKAMQTDDVAHTLNYAELAHIVLNQMAVPSHLLEHVAGRIGIAVFSHFPQATAIDLEIVKNNPPMGGDCDGAGVELHLTNELP